MDGRRRQRRGSRDHQNSLLIDHVSKVLKNRAAASMAGDARHLARVSEKERGTKRDKCQAQRRSGMPVGPRLNRIGVDAASEFLSRDLLTPSESEVAARRCTSSSEDQPKRSEPNTSRMQSVGEPHLEGWSSEPYASRQSHGSRTHPLDRQPRCCGSDGGAS